MSNLSLRRTVELAVLLSRPDFEERAAKLDVIWDRMLAAALIVLVLLNGFLGVFGYNSLRLTGTVDFVMWLVSINFMYFLVFYKLMDAFAPLTHKNLVEVSKDEINHKALSPEVRAKLIELINKSGDSNG